MDPKDMLEAAIEQLEPRIVMWGGGAILDKDGNEIGRFTFDPQGLTLEQQAQLEKLKAEG